MNAQVQGIEGTEKKRWELCKNTSTKNAASCVVAIAVAAVPGQSEQKEKKAILEVRSACRSIMIQVASYFPPRNRYRSPQFRPIFSLDPAQERKPRISNLCPTLPSTPPPALESPTRSLSVALHTTRHLQFMLYSVTSSRSFHS